MNPHDQKPSTSNSRKRPHINDSPKPSTSRDHLGGSQVFNMEQVAVKNSVSAPSNLYSSNVENQHIYYEIQLENLADIKEDFLRKFRYPIEENKITLEQYNILTEWRNRSFINGVTDFMKIHQNSQFIQKILDNMLKEGLLGSFEGPVRILYIFILVNKEYKALASINIANEGTAQLEEIVFNPIVYLKDQNHLRDLNVALIYTLAAYLKLHFPKVKKIISYTQSPDAGNIFSKLVKFKKPKAP